jgi:SAM-dependent methyltransferase
MTAKHFYDELTPLYHLVYPDWNASIERQAAALDAMIRECWLSVQTVLDVTCGIGTQALGLAQLSYHVTASDLSPSAVARARREAADRNLDISFSVADMRNAYNHHRRQFDLVIACDNAIPHLLSDADILTAFRQFYQCTRPGGGCLISVRDYDQEERAGVQCKTYGVRRQGDTRFIPFQVWEFHGQLYDVSFYFIEDAGGSECRTHVMRTTYYAIGIDTLLSLLKEAGFRNVQRLDDRFFQPVVVGTRA